MKVLYLTGLMKINGVKLKREKNILTQILI